MKLIKKNLFSALMFSLIIAVSIVVYLLLPYEKENFDRLIIQCLLSSQILSFLNVLVYNAASGKKKLSVAAGGYTSSIVYVLLSTAVSILFLIYYRQAEKAYLILWSILTVIFVIASILIYTIGKATTLNAAKVEKSSAAFKKLEYKMELICSNNDNPAYEATFEKIMEAIKSCDQSNCVDTDNDIYDCIEQLNIQMSSKENDEKIHEICDRIIALIKQRTVEVSQLKLGGI